MVLPIAMGVAAISRFILTKGMQKAIKKFVYSEERRIPFT